MAMAMAQTTLHCAIGMPSATLENASRNGVDVLSLLSARTASSVAFFSQARKATPPCRVRMATLWVRRR